MALHPAVPIPLVPQPGQWPYASGGMPEASLRGIKEPRFDSEWLMPSHPVTEICFFQRQLGQVFAYNSKTKTQSDTNMQQPGMLCMPTEFKLQGMNFIVSEAADNADYCVLVESGRMDFIFCGNRILASIPLIRMPRFRGRRLDLEFDGDLYGQILGNMAAAKRRDGKITEAANYELQAAALAAEREARGPGPDMVINEQSKQIDSATCFELFPDLLHIKPNECFQVKISFSDPIQVRTPVKIWAFLEGIYYVPL